MTPIEALVQDLKNVVRAYDAAADKFIGKVDRGEARSHETYTELKAARELSRSAIGGKQ